MAQSLSYTQQLLYYTSLVPWSLMTFVRSHLPQLSSTPARQLTTADTTTPCRYRLDNESSATFILPDGRKLGYAQFGDRNGRAVFYFHGLPGSRLEAASLDSIASNLNARIIAVDRPGYGWSSPHKRRTIQSHMTDVELLTQHLGLDSYAAMGVSGGGPYALAAGRYLPADKLKVVAVVCGLGPPDMGYRGMCWANWLGFMLGYPYTPGLVHLWFRSEPGARLDLSDDERLERMLQQAVQMKASGSHPKDLLFFGDVDRMRLFLRTARESYGQGFDALAQDGHLSSTPFGFRVEDIRPDLPFHLWYGKLDVNVPPSHGEQIAARLGGAPRARLHMIDDETHASIYMQWEEQILNDLVEAMQ